MYLNNRRSYVKRNTFSNLNKLLSDNFNIALLKFFFKKIMVNIYKVYFVVYTIFIVAERKVL